MAFGAGVRLHHSVAHDTTIYRRCSLRAGLLGKTGSILPRQSHTGGPEAALGGKHLGDRRPPSSTNPAPTAPAPVHPGRRAREASWVALPWRPTPCFLALGSWKSCFPSKRITRSPSVASYRQDLTTLPRERPRGASRPKAKEPLCKGHKQPVLT